MPYFVNIRHNISLSGMTISRNVRYNTCLPPIDKVRDTFGRSGSCTLYLSRLSLEIDHDQFVEHIQIEIRIFPRVGIKHRVKLFYAGIVFH